MKDIYIRGKRIRIDPNDPLGEGGEASVYRLSSGAVAKLWKPPNHPDFAGDTDQARRNREGAKLRMAEYTKKLRNFPQGLPPRVIVPKDLITNQAGSKVLGFAMPLIDQAEMLRMYSLPKFRNSAGFDNNHVMKIFRDLYPTVCGLHQKGVVIGDFNYRNVLVRGTESWLIDADSMQFGPYPCRGFTARFVDPLICNAALKKLIQKQPHSENTDWYAFALMLFESLLLVHPYGGTYEPKKSQGQIPHDSRPLKRITVFKPDVIYPARRMKPDVMPDELLHFYDLLLHRDKRGVFPEKLLDSIRWTNCSSCGEVHARSQCPVCAEQVMEVRKKVTVRGRMTVEKILSAAGPILKTALTKGTINTVTHVDGELKREDGRVVLETPLDRRMKVRILGEKTFVGLGSQMVVFSPNEDLVRHQVDTYRGGRSVFDTNGRHSYWLSNGKLYRDDVHAPKFLGDVLRGQTYIWAGPKFGFGFYRAGELQVSFIFDAERPGLNDSINIPRLPGGIVDATCYFSESRCWFVASTTSGGRITNHCFVIKQDGTVVASAEADEGNGSWLGSLRGKVAVTLPGPKDSGQAGSIHSLFAATDRGLVRVEENGSALQQVADFPDTRGFVDSADSFLATSQGLLVVSGREIRRISLRSP